MKMLFIEGIRNGYAPSQCGRTMTLRDLADFFNDLAEMHGNDIPVYLRNDNGYTYGNINEYNSFTNDEEVEVDDDE